MRVPWPLDTGSANGTVLSIRVYFIAERKTQPSAGRPIPSQKKIRRKKKWATGWPVKKQFFSLWKLQWFSNSGPRSIADRRENQTMRASAHAI